MVSSSPRRRVKLLRRPPDGSSSSSPVTLSTSITTTKRNEATSANVWVKVVVTLIAPAAPLDGKSSGKAKGVPSSSSTLLPTGVLGGKGYSSRQQQHQRQQQQHQVMVNAILSKKVSSSIGRSRPDGDEEKSSSRCTSGNCD
jgi:hypothetical protein